MVIGLGSQSGRYIVLALAPDIVRGKRVAITSCDSGPYVPSEAERSSGWRRIGGIALSRAIGQPSELPMPGFDEWYVFDGEPAAVPDRSHVNRYGFSVLGEDDAAASFWRQVQATGPRYALGAGTPHMFLVTRDRAIFERLNGADLPSG